MTNSVDYFWIACCQFWGKAPKPGASAAVYKKLRDENVESYKRLIDSACGKSSFYPPGYRGKVRLVVFPEMSLSGNFWGGDYAKEFYERGAIDLPGEETEKIAEKTAEHDVYLIGHGYNRDENWPGFFAGTCFIMNPDGKILTKYRRIHSDVAVSPDEIYDEYIKRYGWDGLFPVADTPIGKIAALACGEITLPEIARMFGLQGAEILAHCDAAEIPEPTLEVGMAPTSLGWTYGRRMRAIENCCYVPRTNAFGGSEIIDYYGRTLVRASAGGWGRETVIKAPVNMHSLRMRRAEWPNSIARLRAHIFAEGYKRYTTWPPNQFLGKEIPNNLQLAKEEYRKKCYENMLKLGILRKEAVE